MISLPGLFLDHRPIRGSRQVLSVFAQYVSEGMIPNRFDDYTNEPHYNTVDASLWFIHAAFEFKRLSGDESTFNEKLLPACKQIIAGYRAARDFNIRMDQRRPDHAGRPEHAAHLDGRQDGRHGVYAAEGKPSRSTRCGITRWC